MKANQLQTIVNNIVKTQFWIDYIELNPQDKKEIEKIKGFRFLEGKDFDKAVQSIKDFDINNIWDKSFWGVSNESSICAIASELSQTINRIKNL